MHVWALAVPRQHGAGARKRARGAGEGGCTTISSPSALTSGRSRFSPRAVRGRESLRLFRRTSGPRCVAPATPRAGGHWAPEMSHLLIGAQKWTVNGPKERTRRLRLLLQERAKGRGREGTVRGAGKGRDAYSQSPVFAEALRQSACARRGHPEWTSQP